MTTKKIRQRCGKCSRAYSSSKRHTWCYQCWQADPEGSKLANRRAARARRLAHLRQLNQHEPIVYAVHLGTNRVKVGTTKSIKRRVAEYRVTVPHATAFWFTPGSYDTESKFHNLLDHYLVEGEVFVLGNLAEALIKLETAEDAYNELFKSENAA